MIICKPITFNKFKGRCHEILEKGFFMDQFSMSLVIVVSYISISLKEHYIRYTFLETFVQ
jgi:hypothetical protein